MSRSVRVAPTLATIVAASLAWLGPSAAQDFPNRPVTMVVPYGPGSPADIIGRLLAQGMTESLGQPVVVENVAGAGGTTGVNRVAKSPPDGYAFVQGGTGTHAISQTLYKKPLYDAATDFAPMGLVGETPLIRSAHNGHFKTVKFLVEHGADVNALDMVSLISGCAAGVPVTAMTLSTAQWLSRSDDLGSDGSELA